MRGMSPDHVLQGIQSLRCILWLRKKSIKENSYGGLLIDIAGDATPTAEPIPVPATVYGTRIPRDSSIPCLVPFGFSPEFCFSLMFSSWSYAFRSPGSAGSLPYMPIYPSVKRSGLPLRNRRHSIYLFAMALFFSSLSVWTIIRRANCKTPISGIFPRFNTHSSKGVKCWFPVFSYTFQGQEYEAQSIDDIREKCTRSTSMKTGRRSWCRKGALSQLNFHSPRQVCSAGCFTPQAWGNKLIKHRPGAQPEVAE